MNFKRSISISTSIVLLTSSLYSDSWSSTQNEHGFILKSDNATLYLGKSCDATSPQYGTGEWYWKDNEIVVSLSKKDISFNSGSLYEDGRCKKGSTQSSSTSLPALEYHWIYDQDGCKHYNPKPKDNETLTWTGGCKNGYADGRGTLVWYQNGEKGSTVKGSKSEGKFYDKDMSDSDKIALAGAALIVGAGLNWLFGGDGSSSSSSSSSSSYSAPSYEYCSGSKGANCYQLIKIEDHSATIKCIKGPSTGEEKCLSINGKGKYATGCGFSDIAAHHYTLDEAGNGACEY